MPPMTKAAKEDAGVTRIQILALPFPICKMGSLAQNTHSRNVKFMFPFSLPSQINAAEPIKCCIALRFSRMHSKQIQ